MSLEDILEGKRPPPPSKKATISQSKGEDNPPVISTH